MRLDQIHDELRDRICLLAYAPGSILREGELAREFGVSRTPIREVLQRLAFAGLVEAKNGIGTIVTSFDYPKIKDIYEMRLKVAELIGHMTPRHCEPRHAALAAALRQRAEVLLHRFEIKEYWRINHELHFLIADLIGNNALREMWDLFYFQAARMWYGLAREMASEVASSLVDELSEVHKAIEADDMVAVGYIERNYIAFGLRQVETNAATFEGRPTLPLISPLASPM